MDEARDEALRRSLRDFEQTRWPSQEDEDQPIGIDGRNVVRLGWSPPLCPVKWDWVQRAREELRRGPKVLASLAARPHRGGDWEMISFMRNLFRGWRARRLAKRFSLLRLPACPVEAEYQIQWPRDEATKGG